MSGFSMGGANCPADLAPRSFIYNSWNDFFYEHYNKAANWRHLVTEDFSITENDITDPSDTIVFAEKSTGVKHWYLDYEYSEDIHDILDQSRHSNTTKNSGGSNYTFADGSARSLKWGQAIDPENLFLVLPFYRQLGAGGNPK